MARTKACGSFFISKPWLRREKAASHLPWLPGAQQQHVGGCDLPRPLTFLWITAPALSFSESIFPSRQRTHSCIRLGWVPPGGALGDAAEMWVLCSHGGDTSTAMGRAPGWGRALAFPNPPLQHRSVMARDTAATPDSRLCRASGLHKVQLAPKQQECVCPGKARRKKKRRKKKEKKKNIQTLPKFQTEPVE